MTVSCQSIKKEQVYYTRSWFRMKIMLNQYNTEENPTRGLGDSDPVCS
jgi:hypothetical protein